MKNCPGCNSAQLSFLNTYKRHWHFCHGCGDAYARQKADYALTMLPDPMLKKIDASESSVYDYFVRQDHIDYSIGTAHDFLATHAVPNLIDFNGKRVLDISGGNGHFLMEIAKLGASVALTEINDPSIDYAKKTHGIDVFKFNFNEHRLTDIVSESFDIIMARAAIMFCQDLDRFAADSFARLRPGGLMIINHSVIPTLGVALRVQLDEFSYFVLRQPTRVVKTFEAAGFELLKRADETDPSMYVYANDVNKYWRLAHVLYEHKALKTLMDAERAGLAGHTFRARDRRRSTMIFRKTA